MKFIVSVLVLGASEPEETTVQADDVASVLEQVAPNFEGYDAAVTLRIAESN